MWLNQTMIRAIGLGSNFWSLIGGATLSLAGSILVDTLQGDALPVYPWFAFAAAACLAIAGANFIRLAVAIDETIEKNMANGFHTQSAALSATMTLDDDYRRAQARRVLLGLSFCVLAAASFVVRALVLP